MQNLENEIFEASQKIQKLKEEISKNIVWQKELVDSIIICLLSSWHILLEGLPWLAKTLTISTISKAVDLGFSRVQFTPDLLPSDLIWTEIFNQKTSDFDIKKWPIFNNFILADEINRAPSKVQSALLEAMAEKSVTIWKETFILDKPFLVLATQNPVEQSWTYKLPEAQLDRFAMKVKVTYPNFFDELQMYKNNVWNEKVEIQKILTKKDIFDLQDLTKKVFVSDEIFAYVMGIVDQSRKFDKNWLDFLKKYIQYGVSPRWWISLLNSAKALALLEWRSYVIPEDIKKLAVNTLSHRISLSYEAIADDITEEYLIEQIISKIEI